MKKPILILIVTLHYLSCYTQDDYSWWNIKHDYDGVSSWMKYIIYSPSYMGPNALPVPDVSKGYFNDKYFVDLGTVYHFSGGDRTFNFISVFNLPVAPGRAGVLISYVPVEFYETDTVTRDMRRARDYFPSGHSFGDFYLTTYLQVIKNHGSLPDVMLTINLKTASGTNLRNARNTDAPGYYFDASASKKFFTGYEKLEWIRPFAMAGFYCYQTNYYKYTQNDAFLYGAGMEFGFRHFVLETEVGGYIGYFNLGDKPMVYRLELRSQGEKPAGYRLFFQRGLNDFPFTSFGFSFFLNYRMPGWFGGERTSF